MGRFKCSFDFNHKKSIKVEMTKSHRWWQWWWWKIKVFPLASNRVDREGKHKGREKREGGGQQDDIFDQRDHWDDIFYQSDDPGGIKWYLTRAAADKTTVHWMSHFYFDTKTLSVWTMPTKYALGQIGPVCSAWTILWAVTKISISFEIMAFRFLLIS